jgi:hypothetical protein
VFDGYVWEGDAAGCGFEKGTFEGGAEIGGLGNEEGGVD